MRFRHCAALVLCAAFLLAAGCSEEESGKADEGAPAEQQTTATTAAPESSAKPRGKPKIAKPTGPAPKKLVKQDLIEGTGATAAAGDQLRVNYVGVSYENGEEFDSSFKTGQPFEFQLGASMVIPGWDKGLVGMKVGGRRKLIIPPELAYGAEGSPPAIGPDETLVFVIDLLGKS